MPEVFHTTRRIEFCETDMAGIVHFANFYIYMEQAEHEFLRSLGLTLIHQQDDGTVVSWPRVSASCSFNAPARFEDYLAVSVVIERIGVKSVTYAMEFHRGETRVARGKLKTVCCRFGPNESMESIEIPSDVVEKLEQYVNE